jgi:DNA-binding protein H-NS
MARKKQDGGEMSAQAIQSRLAEMEAERKRLEAEFKKRLATEIADFAKEIAGMITERGYQVDEVVSLLRKGKKSAPRRRGSGAYAHYVDPDNPEHTYSRGPLPKWLTEKMAAAGFDPSDKTQREEFKANNLNRVG